MAVSKVVYGTSVLVDLTEDTVKADALRLGYTAHGPDGKEVVGALATAALEKYADDYHIGYIADGKWIYENPTGTYTDIYEVLSGHSYFITLGTVVGSRFRAMFTTTDVTKITSQTTVTGTNIINRNNPTEYQNVLFTAENDGYLLISKDNVGVSGLETYVYDRTAGWQ